MESATRRLNTIREVTIADVNEKFKFITNIQSAPRVVNTEEGKREKVKNFRYLREKEAIKAMIEKMELAYQLTRDVHKKPISERTQ